MPTVSFLLGYTVLCPSVLTFLVSAARINPSRPPKMVAVSVEFGKEMTARPDVNTTHLMIIKRLGTDCSLRLERGQL